MHYYSRVSCRNCWDGLTVLVWTLFKDGWYAVRFCIVCRVEEVMPTNETPLKAAEGRTFI